MNEMMGGCEMPIIKHSTYIKTTPKRVFDTLTSAEGWNAWFTDETTLNWNEDGTGEITLRWKAFGAQKQDFVDGGKIVEAKPNSSFVFQWCPGVNVTTVRFTLTEYQDGTLVRLKEDGYSTSEKDLIACVQCATGWGEALTLLKFYLEHNIVCKKDIM